MIVHFIGSTQNIEEDIPYLRRIVKVINENDGVLARDWVETAYHRKTSKKVADEDVDWQPIFEQRLEAMNRADIVIAEVTNYTFSQGYDVAMAMQQKKPTLLVSRGAPIKSRYITGLKSSALKFADYKTEEDLDKIIKDFIRANTVSTKDLRFNMFIDRAIYNHLRTLSYETGKNRSEIIRELIYRDIKKHTDD